MLVRHIITIRCLIKPSNLPGTSRLYYTGNWAKDIYDNYTEKQAEIIFGKVEVKTTFNFLQSKLETFKDEDGKEWGGYDYYAKKI